MFRDDTPALELRGLTKRYDDGTLALEDFDLTIPAGAFFGLLGPSGSGKTTLLRAVAGFVTLDRGQVLIDGQDVGGVPVHARNIGMMFQNYALFPHMSVAENVAFGLEVRGAPRPRPSRDCQEFRVRAGIMGKKETPHAPTQATRDRRRAA